MSARSVVMVMSILCAWIASFGLGGAAIYINYFIETKKDVTPLGMGCFFFGLVACVMTGFFFGLFDSFINEDE